MNGTVVRTPRARRDLTEIADYLAEHAHQTVADRFLDAANETLTLLAGNPELGSPWESDNPDLADVRWHAVAGFPNHLLFYRPTEQGIELIRVLYAARDLEALLGG
jgi:toxin ParE1/3/4